MKVKLLIPVFILMIAGVSFLFAQGQPGNRLLQDQKTRNEVFQDIITHPQMMQSFMNQLYNNPEAMNNMMGYMMQNKKLRRMMMNNMFSAASRDSSFAGYMYNMMSNYPQMLSYMQNMMGSGMVHRGMMGYRNNNQ